MSVLIRGMELPEKCGLCKIFRPEHPMRCAITGTAPGAPYGMPRPEWCPLVEVDSDNLIDANKTIHAQIYNDQYEEFINKSMTIAEFLDNYTYDGCPISETEREVE